MMAWIACSEYLQPQRLYFVTELSGQLVQWSHDDAVARPIHGGLAKPPYDRDAIRRDLAASICEEVRLGIGEYYPRIWRGEKRSPSLVNDTDGSVRLAFQTAGILLARLRELFRTVQPDEANRLAYGLEMRELLIAAATEVESSWRAILKANSPGSAASNRLTTSDYVGLCEPLRLKAWALRMPLYPRHSEIRPFAGWDEARPTQSLAWYEAYNATKHDREGCLSQATLEQVISAVAAVFVMLLAQVGPDLPSELRYLLPDFVASAIPEWALGDTYVPPFHFAAGAVPGLGVSVNPPGWTAVPFQF